MKTSSPRQLELDISDSAQFGERSKIASVDTQANAIATVASSGTLQLPDFSYGEAYANAARIAGRINASSISEEEHAQLLKERQFLLDKKFAGTITKKELNKLEYIRWSLDRIEDAKYGHALDILDSAVGKYEQFAEDIQKLLAELHHFSGRR